MTLAEMRTSALSFFNHGPPEEPTVSTLDIWEDEFQNPNVSAVALKDAKYRDPILIKGKRGIFIAKGNGKGRNNDGVGIIAWATIFNGERMLIFDKIEDLVADPRVDTDGLTI